MFTSTGSSGLYKAPLSKSLLLVPSALSLLLALLLPHCQKFFVYDLEAVKEDFQIWRLICGRIICLDLKDTFCSSLLIYNFRIFERRYGSRKFASFLLGSWVLSAVGDFILVEAVWYSFGITAARNLPSGLLSRHHKGLCYLYSFQRIFTWVISSYIEALNFTNFLESQETIWTGGFYTSSAHTHLGPFNNSRRPLTVAERKLSLGNSFTEW